MFTLRKSRTPSVALEEVIKTWEGLYQNDPSDHGNYVYLPDGTPRLVGTMRGVTPEAYAEYLGEPPYKLTPAIMQAQVTLDVAVDIGVKNYYIAPGYWKLQWNPLTEIFLDWGWGSGPRLSVKKLQQHIAVADDGIIGPITRAAWLDLCTPLKTRGDWEIEVLNVVEARLSFYRWVVDRRPETKKFLQGWDNRARWYTRREYLDSWQETDDISK